MENLYIPLREDELDRLDAFLLDRIGEEEDTDGKDEGVLDVSDLDGFLTAIVSGPVTIPPSQWLPVIWGDFEPLWGSAKDYETILSLMMRHMNGIATTLVDQPEDFEPLFFEREVEGKYYTIVDEWCQGYMRGVELCIDQWDAGGNEITAMLMPVITFTSVEGWEALERMTDAEVEHLQLEIAPAVREIHAWWLERRRESVADLFPVLPVRDDTPGVGRNDPCPCGSGRKYKKCCLH